MSIVEDFEKSVSERLNQTKRPNVSASIPSSSYFLIGMCFGAVVSRIACAWHRRD